MSRERAPRESLERDSCTHLYFALTSIIPVSFCWYSRMMSLSNPFSLWNWGGRNSLIFFSLHRPRVRVTTSDDGAHVTPAAAFLFVFLPIQRSTGWGGRT
jgi:hypothetical protein